MDLKFSEEALKSLEGVTVPLVVYEGTERRVVGEATFRQDDKGLTFDAAVTDEAVLKTISELPEGFSISQGKDS